MLSDAQDIVIPATLISDVVGAYSRLFDIFHTWTLFSAF